MCVIDMIQFWARAAPDRSAIVQSEMVITYRGLADAIESIAERIERLNLDKNEPVAVSIGNPAFMLATIFALLHVGYDVASVNPSLFPHLRGAGIRNLIYDTQGQVASGGRNIQFNTSWLPTGATNKSGVRYSNRMAVIGDMIFFTSGTTGLPKKITQAEAALRHLLEYPFTSASGGHQKILIMPGLVSTFGFNRACEALNAGKTACFAPTAEAALPLIEIFHIELVVASAMQALALMELKKKKPVHQLNSLKAILIGGGRITAERIADIRAMLCRNCISQYGSTEGGVVALAPFESIAAIPGAVGFVLPWAKVEIVDEDGRILAPGMEGSIRYRTPQLTQNLMALDASNIAGVEDQWFYPGDAGSLTADGVLCLAGRITDVINRGGVKVSSAKIEEILEGLPEIGEAAACGVAGSSGMEEIWVAVVAKDARIDIEQLKQRLSEHYEVRIAPDEVFVLDELPRGELGKVQKYRLREVMLGRKRGA
jgi:acyl-coenzyme A synthetase/AMP-(fatty) acid ligase